MKKVGKTSTILLDSCGKLFEVVGSSIEVVDVKTLQSIAGHSDIQMTLDRYAHKRENNVIAVGGLISSVFRSM